MAIFRRVRCRHEICLFPQNVVCDQRIALSAMLSQLMEEKDRRQAELKKRLVREYLYLCRSMSVVVVMSVVSAALLRKKTKLGQHIFFTVS